MSAEKTDSRLDAESALDYAEPPFYRVLLLNDDYTPMDFVVMILETVFHKNHDDAVKIMLQVHEHGCGLCGVYPFEVAEAKTSEVERRARADGYPLRCHMEEENL